MIYLVKKQKKSAKKKERIKNLIIFAQLYI